MNTYWITADRIFDGVLFKSGYAIQVTNGKITALKSELEIPNGDERFHQTGLLTQGFFDVQVNGGGGAFLNTSPSSDGIETIVKAHRAFGTSAILPTVITDAPEVMEAAVYACLEARHQKGVRGIHIEGPHISKARRGTHDAQFVRPMDNHTLNLVRELRDADFPTLITVAPENTTDRQIAELADIGAIVSIGHSDTTAEATNSAVRSGATCFTHLFNAMSPMVNRAPGVTGAAIASEAWCSVIADGIHVDPMMIKIACDARPVADHMIAVSDAMSTVGGPDEFELYGRTVRLKDGRLVNAEGSLAGAHLTMLAAYQNLISYGIPEIAAMRMCRHNPAQMMDLWDEMRFVGSDVDDLIVLDNANNLVSVGVSAGQDELSVTAT